MRKLEIESWALRVIERVESGRPAEDFMVELKGNWPADPNRAARRIAGHANAARGEPILWLIGVDEETGVTGVLHEELANWWPKVQSEFDGVTPLLRDFNISWKGKTVSALLFETDRIPFVVKNSSYGKPGGGSVALEVPWREGNATRSAMRNELILLLSPLQLTPGSEVLSCRLKASKVQYQSEDPIYQRWELDLRLYLTPRTNLPIVIPAHRCEASFEVQGFGEKIDFFRIVFPTYGRGEWPSPEMQCVVERPSSININAGIDLLQPIEIDPLDAHIMFKLHPVDANQAIIIDLIVPPSHTERGVTGAWRFLSHPSHKEWGPYMSPE